MNRKEMLETAMSYVTIDRETQYGTPEDNFQLIAWFWNDYLYARQGDLEEYELTAEDVANMMSLLKIARIATGQKKEDNYADLAGYAACACEIATKTEKSCLSCRFDKDDPQGEYEPCRSCECYNNWRPIDEDNN